MIECKVLRKSRERAIDEGLAQTAGYMDRCAADAGHLVVFDRDPDKRWEDKVFHRRETRGGIDIHVCSSSLDGLGDPGRPTALFRLLALSATASG